jgi:ATP-dependent helicase/nuclease subunit B
VIGTVEATPYGRPASQALAAAITTAKQGLALAPVTVVVPSNFVGLSARRLLGGGRSIGGAGSGGSGSPSVLPAAGGGMVNVSFVTPFRLAELLSADLAGPGRPLTNPVLGAAVRRALAEEGGALGEVAEHHATEAAFARLQAELSHVSSASLAAMEAAGGLSAAAVRVFRRIMSHLSTYQGEDDLVRAARGRVDLAAALGRFGHVICYLPEPVTPALADLLGVVLAAAPSTVIVGLTGASDADRSVVAACERLGVAPYSGQEPWIAPAESDASAGSDASRGSDASVVEEAATAAAEPDAARFDLRRWAPPVAAHIVSASDCDEEVRAVVRRIAALAEAGMRLDRIGVFFPTPDPYLLTLQAQLSEAGIPANGPSRERLADSAAGRTLLGALALPALRWRRDRVMALVSAAPVWDGDRLAIAAEWENLSREAGVVRDLGEWRSKLEARRALLVQRLADPDRLEAAEPWLVRSATDLAALMAFIERLAAGVESVTWASGWAAKSTAARQLLAELLGPDEARQAWPQEEQAGAARIDDALARLGVLDDIEPDPSGEAFQRALAAELDVTRGRSGRFGHGVSYGPLSDAVGHDFDAVFLLGAAEGLCPAPRRDDPLLPDAVRARARPGEVVLQADRLPDQHRAFLAALASAPPKERYLTFPRGDLRSGRHRLPSRWLLDTATALAARPVYSTDFVNLAAPGVEAVASFSSGLQDGPASSVFDRDLAVLSAAFDAGLDVAAHPVAGAVSRGLACLAGRRSRDFTKWDGNLAGAAVPSPANGQLLSATGLERWAACGFRYFLAGVLGLGDREEPERTTDLSPLDRGSGLHEILERFLASAIAGGVPSPDTPWSPADRARMSATADSVFRALAATGRTGRAVHWRLERQRLLSLLDGFLTADDSFRARLRATPERVELPFGTQGAPPVVIKLPDGRAVHFRGRADRVDVTEDGRRVVIDYKTGNGDEYRQLEQGDPTRSGATLQLGLYSEAVAQLLGTEHTMAYYRMVSDKGGFGQHGYSWDDDRRSRFVEVVGGIVDGIEAGVFPAVPGGWDSWRGTNENCAHCEFDRVCPRDRGASAEVKVAAPELKVRQVLVWEPVQGGAS